jgi:hypothetical protein
VHLTGIDFLLWAAGFVAHVILLAVLFARRRLQTFPVFSALIATNIVRTLALYLIVIDHGTKHSYLVAYSAFAIFDLALQLGVVYEMASHVFRPLGHWAPDVRTSFWAMVAISTTIAAGLAWLPNRPPAPSWLKAELIRGNFFSATLMAELFLGMVILSFTVGLPWKNHAARIAQGFGFYSLVCILTEAAHTYLGMDHDARISSAVSYFRICSYLLTVSYWAVTLWVQAPAPRELPDEMRVQLFTLHRRLESDLGRLRIWRRQ